MLGSGQVWWVECVACVRCAVVSMGCLVVDKGLGGSTPTGGLPLHDVLVWVGDAFTYSSTHITNGVGARTHTDFTNEGLSRTAAIGAWKGGELWI